MDQTPPLKNSGLVVVNSSVAAYSKIFMQKMLSMKIGFNVMIIYQEGGRNCVFLYAAVAVL